MAPGRSTLLQYLPSLPRLLYGAAVTGLVVVLSGWLARQQVDVSTLGDVYHFRCQTGSHQSGTLSVRLVTPAGAIQVGERLCADATVARHAGSVSVSWQPRDELAAEHILDEHHDVIWSREHTLRSLVPEAGRYYEKLLSYEDYHIYWLHREATPEPHALRGQRIGLLADQNSHTHYLIPLLALKQAGIAPGSVTIAYYEDLSSLYSGFQNGEIDLISGSLGLARRLDMRHGDHSLIEDGATAAAFFIRRQREDPALRCAITSALRYYDDVFAQMTPVVTGPRSC